MVDRWVTVTGAVVLAIGVVLLGAGIYTVYGIAKDPSSRLQSFKESLNLTTTGPNASFTWASNGYNVTFTDTSTDNGSSLTNWTWEFGDGGFYFGESPPVHTYSVNCPRCTEMVTLNVTDAKGHTSSAPANVTVQRFGSSNGVSQSSSPVHVPGSLGTVGGLTGVLELWLIMFLIGASVARAGWRLLRLEPEGVRVPLRPRALQN